MAKATTTMKQVLHYETDQSAWFAANQALFNRVAAFYFEVIAAHEKPSIAQARHGDTNEHGTAQETGMGMVVPVSDIPC